jgi:DNA (cytosine-5)-methyltransferase 1
LNELSLFSGAGGGLLATKHLLGWKTIGYVEINEYCQKVIAQRIKDGHLDEAPIFGDIRAFNREGYAAAYQGMVDVVTAGFPCQPHSNAGKRLREKDDREMWPDTKRTISFVRPEMVMLENVPGVLSFLPVVISDLRKLGYTVRRPRIVAAAHLGAGHIRRRVWLYAHTDESGSTHTEGLATTKERKDFWKSVGVGNRKEISANPYTLRKLQQEKRVKDVRRWAINCGWWSAEPGVDRVVYGVPNGVDRIGALGNAQVPIVAATAWRILNNVSIL